MRERTEGLTETYNRLHDSRDTSGDVRRLRGLQIDMDGLVAKAYGWNDIGLDHDYFQTKYGNRFTICEDARRQVLQRLLKLNHERYAQEVKQGLHDKKKPKPVSGKGRGKRTSTHDEPSLDLFGTNTEEES